MKRTGNSFRARRWLSFGFKNKCPFLWISLGAIDRAFETRRSFVCDFMWLSTIVSLFLILRGRFFMKYFRPRNQVISPHAAFCPGAIGDTVSDEPSFAMCRRTTLPRYATAPRDIGVELKPRHLQAGCLFQIRAADSPTAVVVKICSTSYRQLSKAGAGLPGVRDFSRFLKQKKASSRGTARAIKESGANP